MMSRVTFYIETSQLNCISYCVVCYYDSQFAFEYSAASGFSYDL